MLRTSAWRQGQISKVLGWTKHILRDDRGSSVGNGSEEMEGRQTVGYAAGSGLKGLVVAGQKGVSIWAP